MAYFCLCSSASDDGCGMMCVSKGQVCGGLHGVVASSDDRSIFRGCSRCEWLHLCVLVGALVRFVDTPSQALAAQVSPSPSGIEKESVLPVEAGHMPQGECSVPTMVFPKGPSSHARRPGAPIVIG